MSTETPTTERIRAMVIHGIPTGEPYRTEAAEQFDRWLAEHDREVRNVAFQAAAGIAFKRKSGYETGIDLIAAAAAESPDSGTTEGVTNG